MLVVVSFFSNSVLEIGSLMRKSAIQRAVGFEEVNQHVKNALVDWIGSAVRKQFQELVDTGGDAVNHQVVLFPRFF